MNIPFRLSATSSINCMPGCIQVQPKRLDLHADKTRASQHQTKPEVLPDEPKPRTSGPGWLVHVTKPQALPLCSRNGLASQTKRSHPHGLLCPHQSQVERSVQDVDDNFIPPNPPAHSPFDTDKGHIVTMASVPSVQCFGKKKTGKLFPWSWEFYNALVGASWT